MKTNNIEKQLRLIDDFFEETPQEVIDKMFQEAKETNPVDVSFVEYCFCLGEVLSGAMEEISAPIVLSLGSIQMESTAMSLGSIQTESTAMTLNPIRVESIVMSLIPIQTITGGGNIGKCNDTVYRNDDTETIKAA